MNQESGYSENVEIDISKYVKMLVKRKKTFIAVFLLVFAIGFVNAQFSPKKYRISMKLQPPVSGESLIGANDIESAENLKALIINNFFDEELKKRSNIDLAKGTIQFQVVILPKTNILEVSIERDSEIKESGVVLLNNLFDVISDIYAKRTEAKITDTNNQIKSKDSSILNAKEKAKSLQEEIKETVNREDKLREEIRAVNINIAQILEKREGLLKGNSEAESAATLLLANYLQNNSSYLNHVNNQFSELSIRKVNLALELKNITSEIDDLEMAIGQLKMSRDFISNLKIIAPPRIPPNPVSLGKRKTLILFTILGLLCAISAVFILEFFAKYKSANIKK
jgi:uncharacterized protein involved in exopolysaccharide biosynthesis